MDHNQSGVAGDVVVVLFHREIEERLGQRQPSLDAIDRTQPLGERNQRRKVREALAPAVQPYAADAIALRIAVIETQVLPLPVSESIPRDFQ